MIIFPKRTRTHVRKNEWPPVILVCNADDCTEQERFPFSTTLTAINNWIKRHGWRTVPKGHNKFHHLCPICERAARVGNGYLKYIGVGDAA